MGMLAGTAPLTPVATVIVAADGTGDYADIQSGIDALPAGGGVVYVKEGTYTLTTALTIGSNDIGLTGAGRATKVEYDNDFGYCLRCTGCSGLLIQGILFTKVAGGNLTGGVQFNAVTKSTIKSCWFEDITYLSSSSIWLTNASGTCENNFVQGNFTIGSLSGLKAVGCDGNVIQGNIMLGLTDFSIRFDGNSDNNIATNNILDTLNVTDLGTGNEIGHNKVV